MYDAHTHFDDEIYVKEHLAVKDLVAEAEHHGVGYFNNVGFSLASSKLAIEQAKEFPNVFAVIGVHPNEVANHKMDALTQLDELANDKKVVAIGEVGLDYFYSRNDKELQKEWFKAQIELAIKHNLPLMLHIRDAEDTYDAYDDVLEILEFYKTQLHGVVVHCFSANQAYALKFLDFGAYIEIGGAVTFKNANMLREAVKVIPVEKMLVETDAPYLTPDPYRGKMNAPKYLPFVVERIAEIKEVKFEEIIEKTTTNAFELFQLAVK